MKADPESVRIVFERIRTKRTPYTVVRFAAVHFYNIGTRIARFGVYGYGNDYEDARKSLIWHLIRETRRVRDALWMAEGAIFRMLRDGPNLPDSETVTVPCKREERDNR